MTVFEKLKELDDKQMAQFLYNISDFDFIENYYCAHLCVFSTRCECESCVTDYNKFTPYSCFLESDVNLIDFEEVFING